MVDKEAGILFNNLMKQMNRKNSFVNGWWWPEDIYPRGKR